MIFLTEQEPKSQQAETIQVEDERTGTSLETLKRAFTDNLLYTQGKYESIPFTTKLKPILS